MCEVDRVRCDDGPCRIAILFDGASELTPLPIYKVLGRPFEIVELLQIEIQDVRSRIPSFWMSYPVIQASVPAGRKWRLVA